MYRLDACSAVLPVFAPADPGSPLFQLVASSPRFALTEVVPGDTLAFGGTSVRVCAARHPVPAVGFRFSAGNERLLGYTGDTNTLDTLVEDYRGCRLLLADGLFPKDAWAPEKPHLSAALAASLARDAGVSSLVVTHLNPLFSRRTLLAEAREIFPDVRLAEAGASVSL